MVHWPSQTRRTKTHQAAAGTKPQQALCSVQERPLHDTSAKSVFWKHGWVCGGDGANIALDKLRRHLPHEAAAAAQRVPREGTNAWHTGQLQARPHTADPITTTEARHTTKHDSTI